MKELQVGYEVSERRACGALRIARSVVRYESVADDQVATRVRFWMLGALTIALTTQVNASPPRQAKPQDESYRQARAQRPRQNSSKASAMSCARLPASPEGNPIARSRPNSIEVLRSVSASGTCSIYGVACCHTGVVGRLDYRSGHRCNSPDRD